MNRKFYVAYFAVDPYGGEPPVHAMDAAREALERHLGGSCQVVPAKAAYEAAGGLSASWGDSSLPAIHQWIQATQAALDAALSAEPARQGTIEDLQTPCIDAVAAAIYAYTPGEWLNVFTAHFGMSDYCESHQEALTAARRWLAIAPGACPIAAADQQIRDRCRSLPLSVTRAAAQHARSLPSHVPLAALAANNLGAP